MRQRNRGIAVLVSLTLAGGLTVAAGPAQALREQVATCGGISVGQEQEVVSDAARDRLGLNGWPDGTLGVLPQGDGTYRFSQAAAFGGSDPARPQRNVITQGTLDDPVRDGVVSSTQLKGLPSGYIWAGGGPVYRDPTTGVVLQVFHLEQRVGTDQFYSELHLGRLDPATGVTTYLGPVVRPELTLAQAKQNADLGMSGLTVVKDASGTDYFHLYFPDFRLQDGQQVATGLSVARAPVQEVIDAAGRGTVVAWQKYSGNGQWDEPALGGHSADIDPGRAMAWAPQVARSDALSTYVMAATDSPHEMVLSTSEDGVNDWSARVPLLRDAAYYDAYPTLVGSGADPSDLGQEFYVYYLQWPSAAPDWDNAHVLRRKVTCTEGLPAARTPFVHCRASTRSAR